MSIHIVRVFKNTLFVILKALVVLFYFSLIINLILVSIDNLKDDYSDYLYVRGFENYGVETMATQVKDNLYKYYVDEEMYTLELENNSVESLEKSISVCYDMLEPSRAINSDRLTEINSFYSNILKGISEVYMKSVAYTFGLGFIWFVFDKIKYHKLIWWQFV